MELVSVIGIIAAILTPLITAPQLIKSYRTKSTLDLSWGYLALLCLVQLLWISYGLLKSDSALIIANSAAFALNLVLVFLKYKYDNSKKKRR